MSKFLTLLLNLSTHNPKRTILGWLVILAILIPGAAVMGPKFSTEYDLPDSQSKIAMELLNRNLPKNDIPDLTIVFSSNTGILDSKNEIEDYISSGESIKGVSAITSPLSDLNSISKNGKVALASIYLTKNLYDKNTILALQNLAKEKRSFKTYYMGEALKKTTGAKPGLSEILAIVAALLVLIFTFGSLVAALVPIITAVLALGISTSLIIILSHYFGVAEFAPMLADLVGLGVGLDYALFIVSRFRKELTSKSVKEAIGTSLRTSGKAVLFAGSIVCIALLGLFSVRVKFLYGVAIAASVSVVVTMLASLSFLPAVLMLLGDKINKLSIPKRRVSKKVTLWHRWSLHISKRPKLLAFTSLLILLALCLPTTAITLGSADASSEAKGSSAKMAFDIVSKNFGKGYTAPLQLIVVKSTSSDLAIKKILSSAKGDPNIAYVTEPYDTPNGKLTIASLFLNSTPQEKETNNSLINLYKKINLLSEKPYSDKIYVGGLTPVLYDFSASLTKKLPGFIFVVVLLSSFLLMILFRSFLIPAKAALMNLISILASFGIVVVSFQWGLLTPFLNIGAGPIEPFLPIILFAILFGLSMDYEVFLVSRIQEEWIRTKNNKEAVRLGLANTGGVITAAALIMIVVFTAFIFTGDRTIQLFGVGLASAIFIDATIIRSILVPALMQSFGDKNWYLPKWLDRLIPQVHLEDIE